MSFQFAHYNYNVMDLDKSIRFYEEALGLKEVRRKEAEDGSFLLAYLGDGKTGFELELTWLRDWEKDHYDLGFCKVLNRICDVSMDCDAHVFPDVGIV